ncbi:MAG: 4Fe-4S dicluster domain-containing protein [Treponema sp.]|jgi:electron transport complex protein RnfC|nr:4Fe-4S dicluster domain-containing protein [Treponema sp.]
MKVYSFPRGGISVDDPAAPSGDSSTIAFLPGLSVIPLTQHAGSPAKPTVFVGDMVREGMLVGRSHGPLSANIHATVPGRVIREVSWKSAEGRTCDALLIRMGGNFELLGKRETLYPWETLSPYELMRLITEFGIVEMEGAGRPVAALLNPEKNGKRDQSLVVRCVFDDPWFASDYALCRERFKDVVEGSAIAARIGRLNRVVFAVSHREKELGYKLLAEASSYKFPSSLVLTGSRYPQHNQRELELALRIYEKREGILVGSVVILGPATLAAIRDAVKLRKPVLDRYVAVGGSAVKNPQVMKVRIGTRIGDVFAECGGFVDKPKRMATGSPFLGHTVMDLDEPVIKTTYAVFAILDEPAVDKKAGNCIGCGECRAVCPAGLDPEDLFKLTKRSQNGKKARAFYPVDECHGCGCCELVCPSRLPLSQLLADTGTYTVPGENDHNG